MDTRRGHTAFMCLLLASESLQEMHQYVPWPYRSASSSALAALILGPALLHAAFAVKSSSVVADDFVVAVNVPAPSHSDDLYFHLSTPSNPQWVAFGFGSQMAGSLIFVVYASEDGKNVTISPRLATGHVMPTHTTDVEVQRLAGSGVFDEGGTFVVNARCTGCRSWNGGTLAITSTTQAIILARGPSAVLESDDLEAAIEQHSVDGQLVSSLNLVAATGPGGIPVVSSTDDSTPGHGFEDGFDDDGDGSSTGRRVHAIFMVGAFLVGFPAGYMFLRVSEMVWMHWLLQSLAALAVLLGMASGVTLSIKWSISPMLNAYHQVIGLAVTALVILTWTAGFVGHRMYQKGGTPAAAMKVHKVLGASTVASGLVNGALGFHFAGQNSRIIGFVVITTLMAIFVSTIVLFAKRRRQRANAFNTPAARNFRQGRMDPRPYGHPPQSQTSDDIPLQSYGARPEPQSMPSYRSDGGHFPPRYA